MKHIALFLHDIYFNKKTGRLVFKQDEIEKYFFFQNGNLIQIKTNQPEERLGEVLFKLERISSDAHARMDNFVEPNQNIGEVLKNKGLISEQDLAEALVYQLRETTLNTFPFFDAEIVFQESEGPATKTEEVRISTPFLIEYGIRRMAFNPALKIHMAKKVPRVKGRSMAHLLTEEEKNILNKIAGTASAEKVLTGAPVPAEFFWKSLYLLLCLDLVSLEYEPAASGAKPETPAPEPSPAAGPQGGNDTPVISDVIEMRESFTSKNYYQILNVPKTSNGDDIKKAYFNLARRFHPDRFDREVQAAYRDQIDEVFNSITNAYRTLINKEKRKAYDAGAGAAHAEEPQDLLKRADIKFRQGKTLYGQERYDDAVVFLEEAVRLRKNKGDFYLLLAMAESKIPAFRNKAQEDFLKAISLEPWNPEAHVGLGFLYKNEGLLTKASKQFQKALEADPDHKLARQELLLINKGARPKGLKRLLSLDIFGSKKK
jgi:curved DNA-binding protein CbpA